MQSTQQQWLWQAIDETRDVLTYMLAPHHDEAFMKLNKLLILFGIEHFYSDGWGKELKGSI